MVKGKLSIGSVVEGFRIDKLTHAGGMAHIWGVTREADGAVIPPFLEGVWRRTHPEDCTSICRLSF
jgi:hypothetical protein